MLPLLRVCREGDKKLIRWLEYLIRAAFKLRNCSCKVTNYRFAKKRAETGWSVKNGILVGELTAFALLLLLFLGQLIQLLFQKAPTVAMQPGLVFIFTKVLCDVCLIKPEARIHKKA